MQIWVAWSTVFAIHSLPIGFSVSVKTHLLVDYWYGVRWWVLAFVYCEWQPVFHIVYTCWKRMRPWLQLLVLHKWFISLSLMNSSSWLVSIIWCKIQLAFIYCGSQFYTISYYSLVKNETLVGFIVYSCWKKWNKATSKQLVLHSKNETSLRNKHVRLSMLKELTKI